jgi:thiol-disulfide isomerase/thioredoxin
VTHHHAHLQRREILTLAGGLLLAAAPHVRATDAPQPRPWPAGKPVPPLALPAHEGPAIDLAGLRGQVVVLNFWASWCEPCREELPSLELLATRHAGQGLAVLLVNFRETDRAIRRFLEAQALSLPILRDGDGGAAKDWGVRIYPTTFVVDRQGRVVFSVIGEVDWAGTAARAWLAPLLAARP